MGLFLASINYQHFKECIVSEFRRVPLPEHFIRALYDRFRPFKPKENASEIELTQEMDIVDFLLATNLLSTIPLDSKVKRKLSPIVSKAITDSVWGCSV